MLCSPLVSGLVEGLVSGLVEAEDGGGGSTPIVGYAALETFLVAEGETYARFEAYLADTSQTYADFEAGSITEENLSAWFAANP